MLVQLQWKLVEILKEAFFNRGAISVNTVKAIIPSGISVIDLGVLSLLFFLVVLVL
jgi:hypothetical protein